MVNPKRLIMVFYWISMWISLKPYAYPGECSLNVKLDWCSHFGGTNKHTKQMDKFAILINTKIIMKYKSISLRDLKLRAGYLLANTLSMSYKDIFHIWEGKKLLRSDRGSFIGKIPYGFLWICTWMHTFFSLIPSAYPGECSLKF